MRKREDGKALIFYSAAVFLFFALSFGSGITRIYGFTLFPDEFGYWSSAAEAAGYDWSKVTAYGSYYSFGYGLILTPILLLCGDAVWTYRIALCVNALLLAASFMLLKKIIGRLIPLSEPVQRVLSAGIAVCYPVWLLYVNMTMTEILLVCCFLLVCELLLRYLERPSIGRFAAAGVSAVYLYTVHLRSVPVLCACTACMLLFWIGEIRRGKEKPAHPGKVLCASNAKERERPAPKSGMPVWIRPLAALAIVTAAVLAAECLKNLTQASVYGETNAALLSVNDYGGQLSNLKGLFTWRGFKELAVSLIGKIYYLTFAGFGLFPAGLWFLIKKMTGKDADSRIRLFCLFVLLSVGGEIMVCAIYTKGYGRMDGLCYGRYDEQILPLLMALGCFGIWKMKRPVRYGAALLLSGLPVTAMLESIIKSHQMSNLNGGYFVAGLSYLLHHIPFEPENYFWKAYALAAVLTALLIAVLRLSRGRSGRGESAAHAGDVDYTEPSAGRFYWLLLVWIGVEVLLGMDLNEGMVYSQNRVRYQDMRMVAALEELREETRDTGGQADGGANRGDSAGEETCDTGGQADGGANRGDSAGEETRDTGGQADGGANRGDSAAESACDTDGSSDREAGEPERRIVCFGGDAAGMYAAVVQFRLRGEVIYFYTPEEAEKLSERDLVLACESEDRSALASAYTQHEVYGIFHLYYNG
ncbi:MAG: hypothetical protein NC254_03505 [bacterium]|nr:hypothetical protein [bacterium]